jgi:hypothetical protein
MASQMEVPSSAFPDYDSAETCLYLPAKDPIPSQQKELMHGIVPFVLLFLRRFRMVEVLQDGLLTQMTRHELGPSEVKIQEKITQEIPTCGEGGPIVHHQEATHAL